MATLEDLIGHSAAQLAAMTDDELLAALGPRLEATRPPGLAELRAVMEEAAKPKPRKPRAPKPPVLGPDGNPLPEKPKRKRKKTGDPTHEQETTPHPVDSEHPPGAGGPPQTMAPDLDGPKLG